MLISYIFKNYRDTQLAFLYHISAYYIAVIIGLQRAFRAFKDILRCAQEIPERKNRQSPIVAIKVPWIMFPYGERLCLYGL
jgi:hypothetical protein